MYAIGRQPSAKGLVQIFPGAKVPKGNLRVGFHGQEKKQVRLVDSRWRLRNDRRSSTRSMDRYRCNDRRRATDLLVFETTKWLDAAASTQQDATS